MKDFSKKIRTDKIKSKIYEIKKWEEKIKSNDLKYKEGEYKFDFQQYETIRYFGGSIYSGKISIHEVELDQTI